MIIEHRTYTLPHGGMDAYLARYRELALPLQMRHLGRLLGFFVSDIGTLNQVLHIWAYDSMADREAAARLEPIRPGRNSSAAIAGPSWRSRCRSGARRRSVRNGLPGTVMSDSTLTNPLLRTLREGGLAASLIVRLFDGPEIGRIAATAGLDALYVDLEHSPVAAIRQPHLQRHPRGGRDAAGARARHRRRADRPRAGRRRARHHRAAGRIGGRRGAGRGLLPPSAARPPFRRTRRRWATATCPRPRPWAALDASVLTAVMIESRNALDAVEAIASVDGLDLLFIGAHDGGGPGPGRPMGPPGAAASAGPHPPGLPGCGQGAGPGRWRPARAAARTGRPAAGLPGLDGHGPGLPARRGHAARAAAAHALRDPAGANPSSSRTAARR